jgi:hypothetical protein
MVRVIVCVSAGALATVLVSWAAVLSSPASGMSPVLLDQGFPRLRVAAVPPHLEDWTPLAWRVPPDHSLMMVTHAEGRGRGIMVDRLELTVLTPGDRRLPGCDGLVVMQRCGFPRPALMCVARWHIIDANQFEWIGALRVPAGVAGLTFEGGGWGTSEARRLPVLPIWSGLAVNAATFGCGLFLLWSTPGFVRRRSRRRRGKCVRCGYELKGIAVCPECGGGA